MLITVSINEYYENVKNNSYSCYLSIVIILSIAASILPLVAFRASRFTSSFKNPISFIFSSCAAYFTLGSTGGAGGAVGAVMGAGGLNMLIICAKSG